MLTELATLKTRLGILDSDTTNDPLLTHIIRGVSARFDLECRRTLARTVGITQEFPATDLSLAARCYPIESVTRFDVKAKESTGWIEQTEVEFLVRPGGILCLERPLGTLRELARVTYTGGYVLPGTTPDTGQTALPAELEFATTEQAAFWFQNRERLGLARAWDYHSTYRHFASVDLLGSVELVLARFRRIVI